MLKAIWILLKVVFICLVLLSLSQLDGTLELSWEDYRVEAHLGMSLMVVMGILFLILLLHKITIDFANIPEKMRQRWEQRSLKKSHLSLTRALVLMSAGDHKHAAYHAHRAQKLLPTKFDGGAAGFVEAASAQKLGQDKRARAVYKRLLDNKESAFLGIQGLMQDDIQAGRYDKALLKAQRARIMYPKQPWILRTVYDLQIKTGNFEKALETLKKLRKHDDENQSKYASDEVALYVSLSDKLMETDLDAALDMLKKSVRIKSDFTPAVKRLVLKYIDLGKGRAARKIIEQAWDTNPHPDLVELWGLIAPENTSKKPFLKLKWFEKLLARKADSLEGQLAVAQTAINDGLWGEARAYLSAAEKIEERADVYQLWAELERLSTRNEEAEAAWLRKAGTAKPIPKWVCTLTHRTYEQWYAIAQPHGSFNTIEWGQPYGLNAVENKMIETFPNGLLASA